MVVVMSKRLTLRLDDDTYERVSYWAKRRTNGSMNQYIVDAIDHMIAYENRDYDLPTLEQQRLNQLIDSIKVLSMNVASLENVTVHGFDSLLNLTRGDNYLLDEEDGDI